MNKIKVFVLMDADARDMINIIGISFSARCVCETLPSVASRSEEAIFSQKVTVKITRSLTLVSLERKSLYEKACQIWSLYLFQFKSYSKD